MFGLNCQAVCDLKLPSSLWFERDILSKLNGQELYIRDLTPIIWYLKGYLSSAPNCKVDLLLTQGLSGDIDHLNLANGDHDVKTSEGNASQSNPNASVSQEDNYYSCKTTFRTA